MYCKECGKSIDDDSKYCRFCGTFQNNNGVSSNSPEAQPRELNVNISLLRKPKAPEVKPLEANKPVMTDLQGKKPDDVQGRDPAAIIVGGLLIFLSIIFVLTGIYDSIFYSESSEAFLFFGFIWKVFAVFWVIRIAEKQNRDLLGWGILGFLLPSVTLLIIGLLKKNPDKISINDSSEKDFQDFSQAPIPFEEPPEKIDQEELMEEYEIRYENGKYRFGSYAYDNFNDALNYAKILEERDSLG